MTRSWVCSAILCCSRRGNGGLRHRDGAKGVHRAAIRRKGAKAGNVVHVAFLVNERVTVDEFHKAALEYGGRDEGAPGLRLHDHKNYYAPMRAMLMGISYRPCVIARRDEGEMSKAFVKDDDGAGLGEALPDREIPPHPNLVTAEGLARIDDMHAQADAAYALAHEAEDRDAMARAARDQRYWTSRRSTAQLVPPPGERTHVKFGSQVTIARDDGRRQTFRIVGQDEADPAQGTLSYVSPMAQALMGRAVGDVVSVGGHEAEIEAIA